MCRTTSAKNKPRRAKSGSKNKSKPSIIDSTSVSTSKGASGAIRSWVTLLSAFLRFDYNISFSIFNFFQSSPPRKLLADIVTLSGDEAIVYPSTFLIGFASLYMAATPEQDFAARRLLRIYGDFGAVCLGEAGLKMLVQRDRPPYKKRSEFICMLGEHCSFPSGHAARAGYAAMVFASQTNGPNFNMLQYFPSWVTESLGTMLMCWAGCVCLSRVALGKHYVSDVVVGVLLGAYASTWWPDVNPQGVWRLLLSLTFTAEIIYIMANESVRKDILGWPYLLGIVVGFWITFPFAV